MKIGDLDGRDKIYDETGCIILDDGEDVIDQFMGECKTWVAVFPSGPEKFKYVELDMEITGTFYTTSRRLVFIGLPRSRRPGFYAGGSLMSSQPNFQYIAGIEKTVQENDARVYFSIPISKVKQIRLSATHPEIIGIHKNGKELAFEVVTSTAERLHTIFENIRPKK